MSVPTILAIVLNLQSTLQGINGASGGYHYTVRASSVTLDPVALATKSSTETPFFVAGHRIEPVERTYHGISRVPVVVETWNIVVEARVDAPGTDMARKVTAVQNLCADVEKAIASAPWSHAAGAGGSQRTLVQQHTAYYGLADQSMCYVEIPVHVQFQRSFGAP